MDSDIAKRIPIAEILATLNIHPKNPGQKELLYLSPIRREKTPSFYVNLADNVWFDHGTGEGGNVIQFAQAYLRGQGEEDTLPDALRWLKNVSGSHNLLLTSLPQEGDFQKPEAPALRLKVRKPITALGLIQYLEKRGIPLSLARQYLEELYVYNRKTGATIIALGFGNEEGGMELRNPKFKGCLKNKAITFIRGRIAKPDSVHLFEGFMDYLSAITQLNGRKLKGDVIVLNSLSQLKHALPYLHNYGYRLVYTWMDNDDAGETATTLLSEFAKAEEGLIHIPMNKVYAPFKDVNEWHMNKLGL